MPKKESSFLIFIVDPIFWAVIYLALNGSKGAENLLTFMFAAISVLSFAALVMLSTAKPTLAPRSAFRKTYGQITTLIEVAVFVWYGWFWFATAHTVSALIIAVYRDNSTIKPSPNSAQETKP
jgi:hypothetical protein